MRWLISVTVLVLPRWAVCLLASPRRSTLPRQLRVVHG